MLYKFIQKQATCLSGKIEIFLTEEDIAKFYKTESNVVELLVKAKIITATDMQNYLDKGGK